MLATSVAFGQATGGPTGALPDTPNTPPAASAAPPAPVTPVPAAAPPTAPAAVAPTSPAADRAMWDQAFAMAREDLLAGRCDRAQGVFERLAQTPPSAEDRARAVELAALCRQLRERDVHFVSGVAFEQSELGARATDRRSTDEISVLYLNAVVYGIGSGLWVDAQTEPDTAAGAILPVLGLAGAAAGGVVLVDRHPLRYGVPQSIVSGMYLGFEEGLVWTLWNQAKAHYYDEWSGGTLASVIWLSATAGLATGGIVGTVGGTTPGRASFVGSAGLWGGAVAGLGLGALTPDDDRLDDRALLAAGLGLNAAAIGGAFAAGPVSPSIARVRFLDLGGISGAMVFGGLYVAAKDTKADPRTLLGVTALGIASGLGVAWWATDGMPKDLGATRAASASISRFSVLPVTGGAELGMAGTW